MRKHSRPIGAALALFCIVSFAGEDAEPPQEHLPGGALLNLGKLKNQPVKIALSPSGTSVAAVDDSGRIYIFDTKKPGKPREFDAGGPCHALEFTPDGKLLLTAGPASDISLWNIETSKLDRKIEGSKSEVMAAALSNDGTRVASTDQSGALRLWDFKTGKSVFDLKPSHEKDDPEGAFAEGIAFSPDGRFIVAESNDVKARCWDAVHGVEMFVVRDHDNTGTCPVCISPGGALAATTRGGGLLRLWRLDSGDIERVIAGHAADISCAAFAPDGLSVLTGSQDRTVRQWDVETGIELRRFACQAKPISVAVSPDGTNFYTLDDEQRMLKWNLTGAPDGFEPNPPLPELDIAWEKLASPKYETRSTAVWIYLLGEGEKTAAHLFSRLTEHATPAANEDSAKARALIAQLDNVRDEVREKAFNSLREMKDRARGALVEALNAPPSSEVRHRAGLLLNELGAPGGGRDSLALEILGTMHSTAAKEALTKLSKLEGAFAARARAVRARMWSN